MSGLAVDGLSSGLDTTAIINQLMALERQPQSRLRTQLTTQGTVISAYQSLSTRLKAVQGAAETLSQPATWTARSATVTGSAVTATVTGEAPAGRLDVSVTSVATAARWTTTQAYGMDDAVFNTAQPPLTVRRADGSSIALYPPSGTMRDVMNTINQASGLGITAVAVKVGTDQYRLQIVADTAGTAAAPQGIDNLGVATSATAATDAEYTINGIPATSPTNTVTDAVSGLTLTLSAPGSATVTVQSDPARLADRVQALVDAANAALEEVGRQTVRDAAAERGPLAGDSGVRSLSGGLLQAVSDAVGSTSAATVGLQTTRDGRLVFDRSAFLGAWADDPDAVRAVLSPESGTGVVQRITQVVDRAIAPGTGTVSQAIQGRESTQRDLQTQIDNWDRRLELRRATLERQFSGMEVALSRLQSQQSWLAGQLGQLNGSSGQG
ncbi:MAG: flagellar filament capping protein FliD [Kineosporiaceae bacterium]